MKTKRTLGAVRLVQTICVLLGIIAIGTSPAPAQMATGSPAVDTAVATQNEKGAVKTEHESQSTIADKKPPAQKILKPPPLPILAPTASAGIIRHSKQTCPVIKAPVLPDLRAWKRLEVLKIFCFSG
jgi:hypothetical protein